MKNGTVYRSLVRLGQTPDDCWSWLGRINKSTGYGKKQFHGRTELAHRWLYQQLFGEIPKGLEINHKCRNKACVNPHHLEVTTPAGNSRDRDSTVLTPDAVREIRAVLSTKKWGSGRQLAKKFGVSPSLICQVGQGTIWTEI